MSQLTTTAPSAPRSRLALTRPMAWLAGGILAGPLFVATVVVQAFTRDGFDPRRHPLSLLSLGHLGWIQMANFIIAGALVTASAIGLRHILRSSRAGTWGPWLIGLSGLALIWGGIFPTDPAAGFPPDLPSRPPDQLSWHGVLHLVAPTVSGLALDAACLVFARRFAERRQWGWVGYCLVTLAGDLATAVAAGLTHDYRWLYLGGALTWLWTSLITARLLSEGAASRS